MENKQIEEIRNLVQDFKSSIKKADDHEKSDHILLSNYWNGNALQLLNSIYQKRKNLNVEMESDQLLHKSLK